MGIHTGVHPCVYVVPPGAVFTVVGRVFLFVVPVFAFFALVLSRVGVGSFPVPVSPVHAASRSSHVLGPNYDLGLGAENMTLAVLKWVTVKEACCFTGFFRDQVDD